MVKVKIPDWFRRDLEKARHLDMHARIAAMPRVRFVCGRDWMRGEDCYEVGVMWDKNLNPEPNENIYLRRFILKLRFRLTIDRI